MPFPSWSPWNPPCLPLPGHDGGHVRRDESESAIPSPITMMATGNRNHSHDRDPSARARSVCLPARCQRGLGLGTSSPPLPACAPHLLRCRRRRLTARLEDTP